MSEPRITVITPTMNQGEYLERTICSVLDQNWGHVEFFVVSRGSDELTDHVLSLYESELSGVVRQADQNTLGHTLNELFAKSQDELLAVLPAGDLYLPHALETAAEAMQPGSQTQWLVGQAQMIDCHDRPVGAMPVAAPHSVSSFLKHEGGVLPLASSFVTREVFEAHGGFAEDLEYCYDYEYWCRLLEAGLAPKLLPQTLAAHRDEAGLPTARRTLKRGYELINAAERHMSHLSRQQRRDLLNNCDARRRILALAEAELHGRHAIDFLLKQAATHPWWLADHAYRRAVRDGVPTYPFADDPMIAA